MSLIWTDEIEADESDYFIEDDEYSTPASVTASCHGVHSWLEWDPPERLSRKSRASQPVFESESDLRAQPACEHEPLDELASHGRLWALIGALEEAIRQLDEAPTPQAVDSRPVAERLRESVLRLIRLEQAIPTLTDPPDPITDQSIIDWRAVNRDQARGMPADVRSEDGSPLRRTRITHFDVYAEESDAEEPLID